MLSLIILWTLIFIYFTTCNVSIWDLLLLVIYVICYVVLRRITCVELIMELILYLICILFEYVKGKLGEKNYYLIFEYFWILLFFVYLFFIFYFIILYFYFIIFSCLLMIYWNNLIKFLKLFKYFLFLTYFLQRIFFFFICYWVTF